jgi:hypothetical protein
LVEVREVVERRVCRDCRWVKYYGAGIWLCKRRVSDSFGAMEVHPLQKGCEWWQDREGSEG